MDSAPERLAGIALIKTWLESVQVCCTIVALLCAVWWFWAQRSTKPVIQIEQTLTQRPVEGTPDKWLISVDIKVKNMGKTDVSLSQGKLKIFQVNPIPGEDLLLKEDDLEKIDLEPGETDQAIFRAYQIPSRIKTIQVSSAYPRQDMEKKFWSVYSFFDVGVRQPDKNIAASTGDKPL